MVDLTTPIEELLRLQPCRLPDAGVLDALDAVERVRRRAESARLALIAEVERRGLAGEQGATTTAR